MADRRRREPAIGPAQRRTFLECIGNGWSVTAASRAAGASARARFYELAAKDERFREQWQQADQEGLDSIADEVVRRGRDGWLEEVYWRDKLVGHVRKFDSNLLLAEARRRDPRYRERERLELTGVGGQPLEVGVRVEHDYEQILAGLEEAGLIVRGPTARAAAEPKALEPGPTQPDGGAA